MNDVARRLRPAAGGGAPAQVARAARRTSARPGRAGRRGSRCPWRIGFGSPDVPEVNDDQRRIRRGRGRPAGAGLASNSRSSGTTSTRPVEARSPRPSRGCARRPRPRAGSTFVDARAQVGRAQLLGARQGDRADAQAGDHRVDPLGPVADQRHHHVAAAHAARGERAGEPRGAVGHLAEGDLAPLAVPRSSATSASRPGGAASTTSRAKFTDGQLTARALPAAEPLQPEPGEVHRRSPRCARAEPPGGRPTSWPPTAIAPTSICASTGCPARARASVSPLGRTPGSSRDHAATKAVTCAADPVEHGHHLGVGGLAEEHAPGDPVLLDEAVERVEADLQARRRLPSSPRSPRPAPESSPACGSSSSAYSSCLEAKCS